jgi:hypothetical protein
MVCGAGRGSSPLLLAQLYGGEWGTVALVSQRTDLGREVIRCPSLPKRSFLQKADQGMTRVSPSPTVI